jgi:hypothetical protein
MLAPGCASMDMFHDFMDRGEQFVDAVNRLSSTFKVQGSKSGLSDAAAKIPKP